LRLACRACKQTQQSTGVKCKEAPPPQIWGTGKRVACALLGTAKGNSLVLFLSGPPNLGQGGLLFNVSTAHIKSPQRYIPPKAPPKAPFAGFSMRPRWGTTCKTQRTRLNALPATETAGTSARQTKRTAAERTALVGSSQLFGASRPEVVK